MENQAKKQPRFKLGQQVVMNKDHDAKVFVIGAMDMNHAYLYGLHTKLTQRSNRRVVLSDIQKPTEKQLENFAKSLLW